jgi:hypothetical protein
MGASITSKSVMNETAFINGTMRRKSIKDIYHYLYQWTKKNKRPFTINEFPGLLHTATGVDISDIYNKWQKSIDN